MYVRFFFGAMPMRKLPAALDNPVDNVFIDLAEAMAPVLKATGHTPNVITTYSFASGVLALVALSRDNVRAFAVLWLLQIFWDCVDGHYARKYGMTSRGGDLYDHVTDVATFVSLLVMVHRKYDTPPAIMIAFACALTASVVHMGCQQRYIGRGSGETLDGLRGTCGNTGWLTVTRWFSHGSMHILMVLAVLYLDKHHRRRDSPA